MDSDSAQRRHLLSLCFQDYISQFKFRSVVAQDLIDFFLTYFPELKDAAVAQREGDSDSEARLRFCGCFMGREVLGRVLKSISVGSVGHHRGFEKEL